MFHFPADLKYWNILDYKYWTSKVYTEKFSSEGYKSANNRIEIGTTAYIIPSDICTSPHFLSLERHRIILEGSLMLLLSELQLIIEEITTIHPDSSGDSISSSNNNIHHKSGIFKYICLVLLSSYQINS